jgi:hypothetical protein
LIALEGNPIDDHVGCSTGVMHTNWNPNSDPLIYFGLIQPFSALINVGDCFGDPITY